MWQWLFVSLQAVSKADIPIHAISSSSSKADTPTPVHAVSNSNVDGPILPVSKVDASCQVDDPTELPVEGTCSLYY